MSLRDHPLWRLIPYIKQQPGLFWFAITVMHASRLVEVTIPLFLKLGIDRIAAGDRRLAFPVVAIIALALLRYAMLKYGRSAVRRQGTRISAQLRRDLFASLLRQGRGFYSTYPTGDLMARAINDIGLIQQMVGFSMIMVVMLGLTSIAALVFMGVQSPQLTLVLFPVLPLLLFVASRLARRIHVQGGKVQQRFSFLSTQVIENLNGIRTIQSLAQEEREIARFNRETQDYSDAYLAMTQANSRLTAWMLTASGIVTLIVISIGGHQVLAGEMSIGTFAAFLFYLTVLLGQLRQSSQPISNIQRASSAAVRLFEILDSEPEITEAPDAKALDEIKGAISLQALDYSYPGRGQQQRLTLSGINLEIAAGETVVILGRVGSGKSTLLRLIARILDPDSGQVAIDGHKLGTIPLAQLRSAVCLVPQDIFLFTTRLAENIAFDDPFRPLSEVWQAASIADLSATIERFNDGLDTLVGERGVTLSGGQKQRVGLARGLIREAPILLLDDCFSAVDSVTETAILAQLRAQRQGQTTLLVSHKVSTARFADRIIVLDEGHIVEQGSHDELIALEGFYARLARLQSERKNAPENDAANITETIA